MTNFGHRLWDDNVFAATATELPPPQFAPSLVNQLGLSRASREERAEGISEWLTTHEPSDRLARSLAEYGFSVRRD